MVTRPFAPTPFLVLLLALLIPALVSGRAAPPQDAAPDPASVAVREAPAAPAGAPRGASSPMMQELLDYWTSQEQRIQELHARAAATPDEAEFLSLQREVEAALLETEVEMLWIQARHARLEGRNEDALRIEAAVEEMTAPQPEALPQERSGLRPRPR